MKISDSQMKQLSGKSILITGGTGSFGSKIAHAFKGKDIEVRIFSRDEAKQDEMRHELSDEQFKFILGDVRDCDSIRKGLAGVDYVFHAAALKQVPSCEFYPMEAIKTNVIGTENLIKEALQLEVKKVVCLSTDKAVYPVNAMGMSKALMEKIVTASARETFGRTTDVNATRYGNVLCSRGSVVPLFVNQIQMGMPLTITDPHMTRFVMSIDEAINLVMFAFTNGKSGDLFVQKSAACTIGDLAKAVKILCGVPNHEIKIIGTRHGEKSFEVLISKDELIKSQDMGDYFRIKPDTRSLNYDNFFIHGNENLNVGTDIQDYHSSNVRLLTVDEIVSKLKADSSFAGLL